MNPLKSIGGTLTSGVLLAVIIAYVTKGQHMDMGTPLN